MPSINVNTDATVAFTNRLERMGRSDFPIAARNTLNKAAFDVKMNTMPKNAKRKFVNRSPNFFKANSRVEMATGFNVRGMKATVGFLENNLQGQNNFAVKDLEQQEHGGKIAKKSFIPVNSARGGKTKMVRPANRLSRITNIVDAKNAKGATDAQKFIKSVYHAGKGGVVLSKYRNKQILWRVNSLNRKNGKLKLTPLYTFKKGRSVSVNDTHFMRIASLLSAGKLEKFYIEEAKKRLAK